MKVDIIARGCKWFISHLLRICLIIFVVVIISLLYLDNLCDSFDLNKIISDNSPIIDLIIWVSGLGGAVILYCDYLAQKQHEAVFGFYANMRFFLRRLSVFLGENFSKCDILVKLYSKEAFEKNCNSKPTEEYLNVFRTLCVEFIDFLSCSKDNIPPKHGGAEFADWYEKQISIVELLQKGTLFTSESYGNYSDSDKLEEFYIKVKNDVAYLDKIIKDKIVEDGLL